MKIEKWGTITITEDGICVSDFIFNSLGKNFHTARDIYFALIDMALEKHRMDMSEVRCLEGNIFRDPQGNIIPNNLIRGLEI